MSNSTGSALRAPHPAIDALKPCPFCGEAVAEHRGPGVGATQEMDAAGEYIEEGREWGVICRSCGASSSLSCDSEFAAIAAWNRRAGEA